MSARKFRTPASRRRLAQLATLIGLCTLCCRVSLAADGNLDRSFGVGGTVVTDIGNRSTDVLLRTTVQPDGKILAVGYTQPPSSATPQFALVRYNADATLDSTFGSGAKVTTVFAANRNEIGDDVLVLSDGKILLAGSIAQPSVVDSTFALVRYNADGTLDTTFGNGGLVTTNVGTYFDSIGSVAQMAAAISIFLSRAITPTARATRPSATAVSGRQTWAAVAKTARPTRSCNRTVKSSSPAGRIEATR